jgi:hypothetical protein
MERVLLGTIRNSGTRLAQYIGGHSISKKHRRATSTSSGGGSSGGGGGSSGPAAPVVAVPWRKQREVLATLLDEILHVHVPATTHTNTSTDTTTTDTTTDTTTPTLPLYPPAWQYPYMLTRARPSWCQGHGSLYDYCYGQAPVNVAAVVASVQRTVLEAAFDAGRLARVDAQQQQQQMQQMQQMQMQMQQQQQQQMVGGAGAGEGDDGDETGGEVGDEEDDALSVLELLDMGAATLVPVAPTSTAGASASASAGASASASAQAAWPLEGAWVAKNWF